MPEIISLQVPVTVH